MALVWVFSLCFTASAEMDVWNVYQKNEVSLFFISQAKMSVFCILQTFSKQLQVKPLPMILDGLIITVFKECFSNTCLFIIDWIQYELSSVCSADSLNLLGCSILCCSLPSESLNRCNYLASMWVWKHQFLAVKWASNECHCGIARLRVSLCGSACAKWFSDKHEPVCPSEPEPRDCPPGKVYYSCREPQTALSRLGLACEVTCRNLMINLTCSPMTPCVPGCGCPAG